MDEDDVKLPNSSADLLKLLIKSFPPTTPVLGMTQDEIWYRAGQRSVIDWLIQIKDRDENNTEDE